jgi:hypothetical protein
MDEGVRRKVLQLDLKSSPLPRRDFFLMMETK